MAESNNERIIEILSQILRVQAILVAESKSITEAARLLKLAGLDNQTIADVMNTSPATIRVVTANLRSDSSRRAQQRTRSGRRAAGRGPRARRQS